ncbi:2-dehydropantoate 2-reductase [Chitinophaga terrae (ex Kim and Jung 2007)]|uniref:ketopantoate reductase family protein n=1 Tax=Chitinophaga terrae (ex Kim and Jung 2007) TaxID=408074 RepID=UPI0027803B83|nr:2-dehydropantoate 2-reductase [Chitinophaga terrae (ex Kim and Jung 2007)]MDQ0109630.1 2-dehydropantoate 2-reductase [Chitinophaga terrae (ex Kim and Jung 2007)]
MKVYIIGYGAIGKALAVFLKREGRDVTLLRGRRGEGAKGEVPLNITMPDDTVQEAAVEVATLDAFGELDGVVVLANKSFGNRQLAQSLVGKTGHSPLVILQNGLDVEAPFLEAGFKDVYRCVLFATAQVEDEMIVRFKPVAASPIGVIEGRTEILSKVVETLSTPSFQFNAEASIQEVIWKKAIVNSAFNSICPLLEIDNGVFYRNEEALAIARQVIEECLLVAKAKGVQLELGEVLNLLLQISKSSDGQLISTLQDIKKHRPTEIDTLNMAIAAMADSLKIGERVAVTRALGKLIKIKETVNL